MSKWKRICGVLLTLGLFGIPAYAFDYSVYSTETFAAMRRTMAAASIQERNVFRREWQNRL